jgi:hypothetical protein
MNRSLLASVVIFGLVCSLAVPMANGQAVFGNVIGTISDPSGAAVANAKVTVKSQTKGTSFQTTTNASGNYTVTHLIPDVYEVTVEQQGFKTLDFQNITVSADADSRVDGQFQVGATSEEVQVTAEAPELKTDRADVSIEFNERYVEDLPIMNRNFTSFELLSPGTQKLVGWSHAATENPQGSQQIFVNGQHFSGTAFELDGTDNQDPILGIIVVNPNLDAIQETKVDLQNYDAEFGKALGGVVTVQTKSGTNDFHGEGFWFRRTDATAARDPFTNYAPNPVTGRFLPPDKWQQFGGTIGGPIIKDKLFFFGDYQATRETNGATNLLSVPTLEAEQTCNPATNGTSRTPGFCDLSEYLNAGLSGGTTLYQSGQAFDPSTGDPSTGANRAEFVKNQIPITEISPQSAAMLALFPAPTTSGIENNFVASGSGKYSQNSFDTRIDFTAGQTVQVFGRFSLDYFKLNGAGSYGPLEGWGFGPGGLAGSSIIHNYSLASGVTKTFSPTLLGDFRFGYFKYNPNANKPDVGTTPMNTFGIPNSNLSGSQARETSGLAGFYFDQIPSSSSNSGNLAFGDGLGVGRCNCPLLESEQQFQWVGNITKIHGNHQFKFGADIRYAMNLRVPSDQNRAGEFDFNHQNTSLAILQSNGSYSYNAGLDLATFLLGDVSSFDRYVSTSLTAAERQHRMYYYGQDTWRVTPKFTLNYGLRWEVYFPEYVNGKDQGGFANIVQGIVRVAGEGPYGLNGNINNDWHYFAPRLGVAYEVNPKTVVRMGYGRSYDMGVFGSNFGHTVTQALPVLAAQLVQGPTPNVATAFTLAGGPPLYNFPAIPSSGQLPLAGPTCYLGPATAAVPTPQAGCLQPHIRPTFQRLPELDAWNATVQRQLDSVSSITVSYVGNKGTHIFAGDGPTYNVNQPSLVGYLSGVAVNQRRPLYNKFTYSNYTDPTTNAPLMCCFTDQGNYLGNDASSEYDAFQMEYERRFSHGLQVLSHYTYAHANKYDSNYYVDDPAVAYGPDDQVRTNVWVANVVYQLPFGKGKTFAGSAGRAEDMFIGGWQVSGDWNWSSGLPWTPSFSECGAEEDVGVCRPNRGSGTFHVGAGPFVTPANAAPYIQFFTPGTSITTTPGFADPGPGSIGNIGFDSFRGPRSFTADAAIMKDFPVTERVRAQFRMDAFNLFNHPVLGFNGNQGNTCIDCTGGNAGQITDIEHDASPGSATGMRQLEFALKLMF